MLFCPSFTQSERLLHTDQLNTRLLVVVMRNFIRMLSGNEIVNVFKSDAVIWWAAIFRREEGRKGEERGGLRETFEGCYAQRGKSDGGRIKILIAF